MQTQRETTPEARALRDQTEQSIADIARFLQDTFSQRVVAFVAGIEDPKQVGKWCRGQNAPRLDSEMRLRTAYQIFKFIESAENLHTARAWMIGMNPQLDDDSPLEAIAGERYKEAMTAARAYLQGDL
ncbi:XRE family transcriptional regulator [Streptomyces sp. RTGN2]|uniref:XRE family transcriptional regulator n=1 Tax=Streptomyces sp. RTGN2 TaxID=3016525 RepID=UPI0025544FEA|nr:XRE family transcriptional regulator [Streptomyces sp. RTGN2]